MDKGKGKTEGSQPGRRSPRRIKERDAKELRRFGLPEASLILMVRRQCGRSGRTVSPPLHEDYDEDYLQFLEENLQREENEE
nr:hypothetical protein Iba_chr06bCG13960 [Ipomoea batatas]GMD95075.1 hypothetical protein Iba_chr15aCG8780 [Ipomoea batatas]